MATFQEMSYLQLLKAQEYLSIGSSLLAYWFFFLYCISLHVAIGKKLSGALARVYLIARQGYNYFYTTIDPLYTVPKIIWISAYILSLSPLKQMQRNMSGFCAQHNYIIYNYIYYIIIYVHMKTKAGHILYSYGCIRSRQARFLVWVEEYFRDSV